MQKEAILHRYRFITLGVLLALAAVPALGQEQMAKLLAADGAEWDLFGISVAVDGDTAVIGAQRDDDHGAESGSVYVFTRSDGVWTQGAKLLPSDGVEDSWFGHSVAVDGDILVIGSPRNDAQGSNSGSAYVFTRSNGVWIEQAKLIPNDAFQGDIFGLSVAVDGDTAVIGAHSSGTPTLSSGAAYVFTRSNGVWTQEAKLIADDGDSGDYFGFDVDVYGDTALIGAVSDDDNGADSGSAYVFTRSNGDWTQQAKLLPPDGLAHDQFAFSVAVDGDTALIGATADDDNDSNSGSVYVFSRSNGVWSQQGKLLAADGVTGDSFGWSVAMDGDVAVIGARFDDSWSGSAYVFVRSDGVWTQQAKLLATDRAEDRSFGSAVALAGETAVIGAWQDVDNGFNAGAAYVFRIASPTMMLNNLVGLVVTLNIQNGIQNSLDSKLDVALNALDDVNQHNDQAAINSLEAFINHVEAQRGNQISDADADLLISRTQAIIDSLSI